MLIQTNIIAISNNGKSIFFSSLTNPGSINSFISTINIGANKINVQVDNNAKDYEVTIDRIEKHDYNSISWHGHIQGDDGQKYSVSFTRGEQLTVGGLDTPDGHYVLQGHGNKGWVASSQLLFKADTSVSDAIHPADVDPNYAKNQEAQPHNH